MAGVRPLPGSTRSWLLVPAVYLGENGGDIVGELTGQQLAAVVAERQRRLVAPVSQRVIGKELACERRERRVVDAEGRDAEPCCLKGDHRPPGERVEQPGSGRVVARQFGDKLVVGLVIRRPSWRRRNRRASAAPGPGAGAAQPGHQATAAGW